MAILLNLVKKKYIARAYPVSDAWRPRLTSVRNGQGLPGFGRSRCHGLSVYPV